MSLKETINLVASKKPFILVVGDAMVDEYIWCDSYAGVLKYRKTSSAPGGAANVVQNALALGGSPALYAKDEKDWPIKVRVMDGDRYALRYDIESVDPIADEDGLIAEIRKHRPDAFVLSDYAKGVCTPRVCKAVIGMARDARIPVVVDPKGPDAAKYRGATVVKPNKKEWEILVGVGGVPGEMLPLFPGSHVLLTLDGDGMFLLPPKGDPSQLPSRIQAVPLPEGSPFDPTGAGDTVVAGLAVAMASGTSVYDAAVFANAAAGLVVRKTGTATVTLAELRGLADCY